MSAEHLGVVCIRVVTFLPWLVVNAVRFGLILTSFGAPRSQGQAETPRSNAVASEDSERATSAQLP